MTIQSPLIAGATLLALSLATSAAAQTRSEMPPAVTPTTEAAAAAPMGTSKLDYSNKWRIEVSEGAKSDGEILFHVTPKGGATQEVRVVVIDKTSENGVARAIEHAFKQQLDAARYEAEVDDGEDVLVEKKSAEPVFALQFVTSTVKSVRINLDRE